MLHYLTVDPCKSTDSSRPNAIVYEATSDRVSYWLANLSQLKSASNRARLEELWLETDSHVPPSPSQIMTLTHGGVESREHPATMSLQ